MDVGVSFRYRQCWKEQPLLLWIGSVPAFNGDRGNAGTGKANL